jgi:hypothetical protein
MTGLRDSELRERFFSVAEEHDNSDWDEVVARAGINVAAQTRKWELHPRALLAIGASFVLGLGVATALGVRLHTAAAAAPLPGPNRVERLVSNGTVKWLFAHEPRGQSLTAAHIRLGSTVGAHWQPVKFARVVAPDSRTDAKIVLSLIGEKGRNVCMTVFLPRSGSGGCAIGLSLRPFNVSLLSGTDVAPDGGFVLAGVASDDVARLKLFLPHGRQRTVPLKDNTFVVAVTEADSPATLVAYDAHDLVIGRFGQRPVGSLRTGQPPVR